MIKVETLLLFTGECCEHGGTGTFLGGGAVYRESSLTSSAAKLRQKLLDDHAFSTLLSGSKKFVFSASSDTSQWPCTVLLYSLLVVPGT